MNIPSKVIITLCLLVLMLFAKPIVEELSWIIAKSLWTDKTQFNDFSASTFGGVAGAILFVSFFVFCFWIFKRMWFPSKSSVGSASSQNINENTESKALIMEKPDPKISNTPRVSENLDKSSERFEGEKEKSEELKSNLSELLEEDKNSILENFPNASLILEYSDSAQAVWSVVQFLPEKFQKIFLKKMDMQPDAEVNQLALMAYCALISERPYIENELAFSAAIFSRSISFEAEDEFVKVLLISKETIPLADIKSKISLKYDQGDNGRVEAFEYLENLRLKANQEKQLEEQRLEAERLEQERLEAEQAEKELLEEKLAEAKRIEEQKLEEASLEKERLEQERLKAEQAARALKEAIIHQSGPEICLAMEALGYRIIFPTDRNFASASHYRLHDGNKYMTFSSQVELEHYAELVLHRLNPSKR